MNDMVLSSSGKRMSSLEVAELVESRHDKVKQSIERLAKREIIELPPMGEISTTTRPMSVYLLDKRSSLIVVAQLSPEFTARVVDRWQELEQKALTLPNFSNPAEAARAWAEQFERAQIAESTKAHIGARREATAMNTASQAVKKVANLEQQLDRLKQYCTVKRMSMIHHGLEFSWRELKSASSLMGLPPVDVFDQNYGTVKAYHADVWKEVYAVSAEHEA